MPSPLEAPVTTATRSSSRKSFRGSISSLMANLRAASAAASMSGRSERESALGRRSDRQRLAGQTRRTPAIVHVFAHPFHGLVETPSRFRDFGFLREADRI